MPADHRVEPVLAGSLGEVASELVQDGRAAARRLARLGSARGDGLALRCALVTTQQLQDGVANAVEVGAQLDQGVRCHTLTLANEAEQDVLGADVGVVHLQRLAQRQLEHLLGARGERDVPGGLGLTVPDDLFDLGANSLKRDAHLLECLGGDSLTLMDEAEQDVLRADVVVVEQLGLVLGQHHHSARAISETLEHSTPQVGPDEPHVVASQLTACSQV